jgi:hypothetical protein
MSRKAGDHAQSRACPEPAEGDPAFRALLRSPRLLLNNYESSLHFVQHRRKLIRQQRLLGIDHHVHGAGSSRRRQPYRFPQPPLHAIAHHRPAQRPAHRESYARPRVGRALLPASCARQIKHGHGGGKMPPPLFVDPLKIRVTQQSPTARESDLPPRPWSDGFFLGSVVAHGDAQRLNQSFPPTRGNLVSPRPACAPWRGGAIAPSGRLGSSCACEIHASSIACAGWVGMYAWA